MALRGALAAPTLSETDRKRLARLEAVVAEHAARLDEVVSPRIAQNCTNLHVNHRAAMAPTPLTACEGRCASRYWKQRRARNFQMLEANAAAEPQRTRPPRALSYHSPGTQEARRDRPRCSLTCRRWRFGSRVRAARTRSRPCPFHGTRRTCRASAPTVEHVHSTELPCSTPHSLHRCSTTR